MVTPEEGQQQWVVGRDCFDAIVSPYLLSEDFLCTKKDYTRIDGLVHSFIRKY